MITLTEENKRLFGEQVSDHISKLNELMGFSASAELDDVVVEKVNLATRLLEGSTRMLGLASWADTLSMFHELLTRGVSGGSRWDEKLSQVVSEVLESEEQILAEILTGELEDLECSDHFSGLQKEMEYLLNEDFVEKAETRPPETGDAPIEASPGIPPVSIEADYRLKTTSMVLDAVERITESLERFIDSGSMDDSGVREVEGHFGRAEFAVEMLHNIVRRLKGGRGEFRARVDSRSVVEATKDFFSVYKSGERWNSELEVDCEDFSLDLKYARAVASVSQAIVMDISRMFAAGVEPGLVIYIGMRNEEGKCIVDVRDNGSEFLNDSKFDKPDPASFYHCLREARSMLELCDGLMWIEPSYGQDGRFRFAMPVTDERLDLVIFKANGHRFAIRNSVLDSIVRLEEPWTRERNGDRSIEMGGVGVPVFSMAELLDTGIQGDESEEYVAVLGLADRRMGVLAEGEIERLTVSPIQVSSNENSSIVCGILNVGDDEIPVLDTIDLMNRSEYLRRYEMNMEDVGGFIG